MKIKRFILIILVLIGVLFLANSVIYSKYTVETDVAIAYVDTIVREYCTITLQYIDEEDFGIMSVKLVSFPKGSNYVIEPEKYRHYNFDYSNIPLTGIIEHNMTIEMYYIPGEIL